MNQENQNTEYKRIWKDDYLKWVAGFANAHGGKIRQYIWLIFILLLCSCSKTDKTLGHIEEIMVTDPEAALNSLAHMDTTSLSDNQKARKALLQAYIATIHVMPIDITPADLLRATSAFDNSCSTDEVKSLIIKSEFAKAYGNPVARLELLKDGEFLASQLGDKSDLAFIYLYLSNAYSNGFNGIVSEYYADKSLRLFNELGYRKQIIDAKMGIVGALAVKRNYATMLDSLLSMKTDVINYSTDSYKQYYFDTLARALDENGRSDEAIEIWHSIYHDRNSSANTLAHWAHAYLHNNQPDSAELFINRAIALSHSNSDEYLCRNVQYAIVKRLGRKAELPAIDSLRSKAANVDYGERKIAETSLAMNKKYDSTTQSAWKEIQTSKLRTIVIASISAIIVLLMIGSVLFYRKRNQLLRVENENNLLRLQNLENNLFENERQHNAVAGKISALFKTPFNTIDQLASAYFECRETGLEQKRIFAEAKLAIEDFSSTTSLAKMEEIVNTTNDNLMSHFDEDFPKLSASQRKLALFLFCGLSLQSISIFQGSDLRNIYVYKSRLKSTITKSDSPRKELYLSYFA